MLKKFFLFLLLITGLVVLTIFTINNINTQKNKKTNQTNENTQFPLNGSTGLYGLICEFERIEVHNELKKSPQFNKWTSQTDDSGSEETQNLPHNILGFLYEFRYCESA